MELARRQVQDAVAWPCEDSHHSHHVGCRPGPAVRLAWAGWNVNNLGPGGEHLPPAAAPPAGPALAMTHGPEERQTITTQPGNQIT